MLFFYRQQYPHSIVRLQFYQGTPLLLQDFYVRLKKENTSGEEYTLHERTWARGAGLGCGAGGRRTRPAPGRGAGMRAPPEVPQSRRGRKGRASGCPRPAAAVTAPARAPPSPRRQAAPPPPHRVGIAAARAPHPLGFAQQPARGTRSAQLTFRLRRVPQRGAQPRNGGGY